MNNATINTEMKITFWYPVFISFVYRPCSEIAEPYCSYISFFFFLSFFFWETFILFSIVAALIYIPTHGAWGFPFLHIFTNTCYCLSSFLLTVLGFPCSAQDFSSCGVQTMMPWSMWDLSSLPRDQTCVPNAFCIGRQILNHWNMKEVPGLFSWW